MSTKPQVVFPPSQPTLLRIKDRAEMFPVRRVYCVGRNFADHAIEMGCDPSREPPFFFQKNPDNLFQSGQQFVYPPQSSDVHYEVEYVVFLKDGGSNISVDYATKCIFGYAVGIDFTRRDLQAVAKKFSRPWEAAKAFEGSAPVSEIVPVEVIGHPSEGEIWLERNGRRVQSGNLNQMIWKIPEIIAELSRLFHLTAGDVIFTGTPAGVGAVTPGDRIECGVDGIAQLSVRVE